MPHTPLSSLPVLPLDEVISFLEPKDQGRLEGSSRKFRDAKPFFNEGVSSRTERIVSKLLEHVAKGNQDKAEELLKKFPEHLLIRGNVTDLTGRQFIGISCFEYALWAMDAHMAKMMERCIPKGAAGVKIRSELWAQYKRVTTDGIDYKLTGTTVHECHFDYNELITAYKHYLKYYETWTPTERIAHWSTKIGGAQSRVPMHVANEFCHPDRSFHPLGSLTFNLGFELPRVVTFNHELADRRTEMVWFPLSTTPGYRLGVDFGIYRGQRYTPAGWEAGGSDCAKDDIEAFMLLRDHRRHNLRIIGEELAPNDERCCCVIS